MNLNKKNYYSNEADWQYMSVSQFKDFQKCEAATLAKLKGDWQPTSNPVALLVGNYVHSYFESEEAHEEFIQENKTSILKKDGKERSDFLLAKEMIATLKNDDFFDFIYQGEKERIVKQELYGVPWKARIDCLNVDKGYFIDLKTTRQLDKRYWSKKYGRYVSFVEEYGYILQMGIYKQLLEFELNKEVTPYIFAVTKETPPAKAAIKIHPSRYEYEFRLVEEQLPHILKVKSGEEKPRYCGNCEYCRLAKRVQGFIEIEELLD